MSVHYQISQAMQHVRAGRLAEAEQLRRAIMRDHPNLPALQNLRMMVAAAYNDRGIELRLKGAFEESNAMFDRSMNLLPENAHAHCNKGNSMRDLLRFDAAIAEYRRAIQIDPRLAPAHTNLGNAFSDLGQFDHAVAAYQKSLEINPDDALVLSHIANALRELGRLDAALAAVQKSIRLKPTLGKAFECLGNIHFDSKKFDEAIVAFKKAIELNPSSASAYSNLGSAMGASGKLREAVELCAKSVQLNPNHFLGFVSLGSALAELGRYKEASAAFERVIQLRPETADAHWNLSFIQLVHGDFERGWIEHEWRKKSRAPSRPRKFSEPEWAGENLDGRTILLFSEQGLGDTIQFVRYVPQVAARGGRVVLSCPPELIRLLKDFPGISRIPAGDDYSHFDCQCALMSLPKVFGTRLETIPAPIPYLNAPIEQKELWRTKLGDRGQTLRVGLAWAGHAKHSRDRWRSMKLEQLAPLAAIRGIRFYSLQIGDAARQAKTSPTGMELIDLTSDITDFADTAGLVDNLDLVISVDTASAHLAGAMGKPVWLLLPCVPDWRWLLDRTDSPWYPTMRIFRQSAMDDWSRPITEAAHALADFVSRKR